MSTTANTDSFSQTVTVDCKTMRSHGQGLSPQTSRLNNSITASHKPDSTTSLLVRICLHLPT